MESQNGSARYNGRNGLSPADRRGLIPELGLREYWYPGIPEGKVGRKPTLVKLLGDDVIFWRGKDGVVAFHNSCPHRGSMLHMADCWWKGTITCTYHGWTFDESGECVAVLGEGPDSRIPGKPDARAAVYPTRVLKGIVFVWMGHGEPAPIEEDVPEEFFDPRTVVLSSNTTWPCNWRPAMENIYDAHVQYVHKDSIQFMTSPIPQAGPTRPRPQVINGRALTMPFTVRGRAKLENGESRPYQEQYAGGIIWPRHRWRLLWSWLFPWMGRRAGKKPRIVESPEWQSGHHLPSMFRSSYGPNVYTRWAVPIDAGNIRLFYFHTAKPRSWIGRAYERFIFHTWHDWSQNFNFSGQDGRQMVNQYYDKPEKLSATDVQTIEWRKLVLRGRGMPGAADVEKYEAEVFAERLAEEMEQAIAGD